MNIKFYYNTSDDRQINKVLLDETIFQGEIRGEANLMTPVIRFSSADILRYNYCYIPDFQRYYSITSVEAVSTQIYDVTMDVDVLMSFKNDILQLPCIVNKQTDSANGDTYIDDGSLVSDNMMFSSVYNFTNGFNSSPEFILITAG